jgi:hypothetical protein
VSVDLLELFIDAAILVILFLLIDAVRDLLP